MGCAVVAVAVAIFFAARSYLRNSTYPMAGKVLPCTGLTEMVS